MSLMILLLLVAFFWRRNAVAAVLLLVFASACVAPLKQQQALATLHTNAKNACIQTPSKCAALDVCTHAIQDALSAYQRLSTAVATGGDESVPISDAVASEATARSICAIRGVK